MAHNSVQREGKMTSSTTLVWMQPYQNASAETVNALMSKAANAPNPFNRDFASINDTTLTRVVSNLATCFDELDRDFETYDAFVARLWKNTESLRSRLDFDAIGRFLQECPEVYNLPLPISSTFSTAVSRLYFLIACCFLKARIAKFGQANSLGSVQEALARTARQSANGVMMAQLKSAYEFSMRGLLFSEDQAASLVTSPLPYTSTVEYMSRVLQVPALSVGGSTAIAQRFAPRACDLLHETVKQMNSKSVTAHAVMETLSGFFNGDSRHLVLSSNEHGRLDAAHLLRHILTTMGNWFSMLTQLQPLSAPVVGGGYHIYRSLEVSSHAVHDQSSSTTSSTTASSSFIEYGKKKKQHASDAAQPSSPSPTTTSSTTVWRRGVLPTVSTVFPVAGSAQIERRDTKRVAFSNAEDEAIEAGFVKHRGSWQKILKDPTQSNIFKPHRDANGLKDRYRNLHPPGKDKERDVRDKTIREQWKQDAEKEKEVASQAEAARKLREADERKAVQAKKKAEKTHAARKKVRRTTAPSSDSSSTASSSSSNDLDNSSEDDASEVDPVHVASSSSSSSSGRLISHANQPKFPAAPRSDEHFKEKARAATKSTLASVFDNDDAEETKEVEESREFARKAKALKASLLPGRGAALKEHSNEYKRERLLDGQEEAPKRKVLAEPRYMMDSLKVTHRASSTLLPMTMKNTGSTAGAVFSAHL